MTLYMYIEQPEQSLMTTYIARVIEQWYIIFNMLATPTVSCTRRFV